MLNLKEVQHIINDHFGIFGNLTPLPGEYDLNFYVQANDGREFVLKLSRPDEDPANIEMQIAVLQFLQHIQKPFQTPEVISSLKGHGFERIKSNDGYERIARLLNYFPNKLFAEQHDHSPGLINNLGIKIGHLAQVLSQFKHPAAKRYSKWDLKEAHWIRDQLSVIENSQDRECVSFFLNKFAADVVPYFHELRQSVIHGDLNDYNILADANNILGFIDFGDLVETATVYELAIAASYAMLNKPAPIAALYELIKGYHSIFPLTEKEISVLFPLICIRLCVSVVNSAIRKRDEPDNAYLTISEKPAWELLRTLRISYPHLRLNCENFTALSKENIYAKRQKYIGKNISLSYHTPLQIVRGEGQYLFDEIGRQYLDCVNNVCHVGHCHPKVVKAGQAQMAVLNTNTRYLHENLVRYAERLLATLPKPLEVCFFVSSGSEANELALRLAETHTNKNHFAVLDQGYYGNTARLINISPYKFNGPGGKGKPEFVQVLSLPDLLRDNMLPELLDIDKNTAAFIGEALPSCGGQVVLPENYLSQIYTAIRKIGGVCIADEVQIGLGRVGINYWGFETQHVIPDIVTMGKPLGNGHPMGVVVTTREIAESFANGMEYFNTFGGNPVSCAIGLAVLEIIETENLQTHAYHVGQYLKEKLNALKVKYPIIGDVRGLGLFLGIEIVNDKKTLSPDKTIASNIVNSMKEYGILLSTDGRYQNVIKIKPPLVFSKENADFLAANLDRIISAI